MMDGLASSRPQPEIQRGAESSFRILTMIRHNTSTRRFDMRLYKVLAIPMLIGAGFIAGASVAQNTGNPGRLAAAAKATGLPKDIYPDQLARVPMAKREELNDEEKKIFDGLEAQDYTKEVGIWSQAGVKLNAGGLSALDSKTNGFLRKSPMGGAEYELATLIVSREMNIQVMWTAHEPQALKRGVSKEAIDVIKYRKPTDSLSAREAIIIQLCREIFQKDRVSSETFAKAEKELGRTNLFLLNEIVGYRTAGAETNRVFDQHLNPNLKPLLPLP
jgi:4-carboxymuconolactone decarboxylase